MPDCGARSSCRIDKAAGVDLLEHLNRCLPDTDKAGRAWQKALNPLQNGSLTSVCRELPRVVLAAWVRRVYRLQLNRVAQTYLP
jgi:hypothetical protein